LYGDAPMARPKCDADSKLTLATFGAHENKIGNVSASDEQNYSDAAHKDPKDRADITDNFRFQRQQGSRETSLLE
jgi:hypothetical protein